MKVPNSTPARGTSGKARGKIISLASCSFPSLWWRRSMVLPPAVFVTALLCDIRLAVPGARLIMLEINIGLPCMLGSFLLAQELFWSRAKEMVLSGRDIEAREAKHMGIVHDIVEPDKLAARGLALARELAAKPPHAMRLNIQRFRHMRRQAIEYNNVFEALETYQGEAIASGEPQRVMAEFLAKRAARKN